VDPINNNILELLNTALETSGSRAGLEIRYAQIRAGLHGKWERGDPQYRSRMAAAAAAERDRRARGGDAMQE
jgi:hypothetical protein